MTRTSGEYDPRLLDWVNDVNQGQDERNESWNPLIYRMSNVDMWEIFGKAPEKRAGLVKKAVEHVRKLDDYPEKARDFLTQAAIRHFATFDPDKN